jgi:tol-pal system protein YbgF
MTRISAALFLILAMTAAPALAQIENDPAAQERMERLERDIMLLQRQVARSSMPAAAPITSGDMAAAGGPAQLEVRLSAMEEQLRNINGKVEENNFQTKKLTDNFEKFQKDTELRFNDLNHTPATAETPAKPEERKPLAKNPAPDGPTTAGDGVLKADKEPADDGKEFSTPRDHYNYAFRLLNQTKYEEAAKSFDAFTKKYPKDPLVGNAYYWQGETYYIRRDYVTAADNFRQGFEAVPTGPKAPDNLLKLAMSLDALKRDKEACVVLGQVVTKFKKGFPGVAEKAGQEQQRIGCK